LIILKIITMG